MEEQIVKSLIEHYKEQGIDLYAVVDDPLFINLPLAKKVELLKQFASHIASGTSQGLTKKDIKSILLESALAGGATGFAAGVGIKQALNYFSGGVVPYKTLGIGVAVGAGVSALSALANSRNRINQRNVIRNRLENLSTNPTDNNAIKLLALRNSQINPNRNITGEQSHIGQLAKQFFAKIPDNFIFNSFPAHAAHATFDKNLDTPGVDIAPDYKGKEEEVFEAMDAAKNKSFQWNMKP